MKIGDKIKARRIELGLSVDELAEKIGKNRSTVYRYENNEIEHLPTTILEPLVRVLQVSPDYFMSWEDLPTKKEGEIERNVTKSDNISPNLSKITDIINNLNKEGQEKLLDYGDDLVKSGKYSRDSDNDTIGIAAKGGSVTGTANKETVFEEAAKFARRKGLK